MELGTLMNRSGLTQPEVSLTVSPGFFAFWPLVFYYPR